MQQKGRKKKIIFGIIVLVSVLIRVVNLDIPIGNDLHAFRQTQTAITIQNYFKDGWSLLHYETPVFGKPWQVLMECPIYQTVVYAVMRMFGQVDIDYCCRMVSLAVFYLSAVMLKKTTELFVKGNASFYICSVYLLSAFNIYWSRAAMIDFMSVLFALVYVWGLYGWLLDGKLRKYMTGLLFGCLAYLLKATTMFPYVYLLTFLILTLFVKEVRQTGEKTMRACIRCYLHRNLKRILLLANICIIPAASGALWTYYADYVKSRSEYTAWLTSAALRTWNYGTFAQKCELGNWKVIIERLYLFFGGGVMLCALLAGYLAVCRKRNALVLIYSSASCVLAVGTLFNLYFVHDYYFMAVSPFVCTFIGILLFEIKESVWNDGNVGKLCCGVLCAVLVGSQMKSGQQYLDGILYGSKEARILPAYVNEITDEGELIVVEGEDWSSATLYYAQRKGFMLKSPDWLTQDRFFEHLKQDGYTTLVAHSIGAVEIFAQRYDSLVQYPGRADAYIYKFSEIFDTDKEPIVFHEKMDVSQIGTEYLISSCGSGYLGINYEDTGISRQVTAEITDSQGNVASDIICLPAGCDKIYYRIDKLCQNPNKIKFASEEESVKGLVIEY